jgi:hypothetical protein
MDVRGVDRVFLHHIDPETVQLELAARRLELQFARERRDMLGDGALQIGENTGAMGQIVQRGIEV